MFLHIFDAKDNKHVLRDLKPEEYLYVDDGIYIDLKNYEDRTGHKFDTSMIHGEFEYLKDLPNELKEALRLSNEILDMALKVQHVQSDPEIKDVDQVMEIIDIVQENFGKIEKMVGKPINRAIFTPVSILKNPMDLDTYIVVHMYDDELEKYVVIKVDDLNNTKEILVGDDYLSILLHGNSTNISDI